MKEIMLSILVPTYNHERYIVQALESVRMQKTEYLYEVLVGEDCSTDNTRQILKEYERLHPNFLTVFYRDHNMNHEKIRNSRDLSEKAKGKYVITLEGDDYWIDEYKIQKQIDFLEKHNDYIAVAHRCMVVDENSNKREEEFPDCKDSIYTLKHYAKEIVPGQTTTVMYRNYRKQKILDLSLINENIQPGDRRQFFSLVSNGKVYCIQEIMSAYRHVYSGGSSHSATYVGSYDKTIQWYRLQLEYAYRINNRDAIHVAEMMYLLEIRSGVMHRLISLKRAKQDYSAVKSKISPIAYIFRRDIWKVKTKIIGRFS